MAREKLWLWLGGGFSAALIGAALILWSVYGPLVFVNALTAAWSCF